MLFIIARANHPGLTYRGGQGPIVHLEADLHEVVDWAAAERRRWAFTTANAAARYAEFYDSLDELSRIDWRAVYAMGWRDPDVQEMKQSEFLVRRSFPWRLVRRIGVRHATIRRQVEEALDTGAKTPRVEVLPGWYY
jgi:hypothetical protein